MNPSRLALVFALALAMLAPTSVHASLVAYYNFDTSLITDSSGNGYTASNSGAVQVSSRFGQAAAFDGINSYIALPANTLLNNLQRGNFTLTAWAQPFLVPPGSGGANNANYGIIEKAGYHSGLKYGSDQKYSTDIWRTVTTNVPISSPSTYGPVTWHHVAVAVSTAAGTVNLYVDGQPAGSASFTPGLDSYAYGSTTWKIGNANPGAGSYRWPMAGRIDEVKLYDETLSASAIQSMFNAYAATPRTILAGYRRDYQATTPKAGWKYMWNANGTIGNPANYVNLLWDNSRYESVANSGYPDAIPGRYVQLSGSGGHPGEGSANPEGGNTIDRFAIAAYTVDRDGLFDIVDSFVAKPSTAYNELDIRVFVNNGPAVVSKLVPVGNGVTFDASLGWLSPGDTVYVALGPNTHDYNDAFSWDFNLAYTEIPEPLTLSALLMGASVLGGYLRRRR